MPSFPIQPLSLILRTLPNNLHSEFFSRLFNHLLRGQWIATQLQDLDGKVLSIVIADTLHRRFPQWQNQHN